MVLASMVTLIMALALRVSLQAWERGNREGDKVQVETSLSNLLERQLETVVRSVSFTGTKTTTPLEFYCGRNLFTFFTRYSPQGTPRQGLIQVVYYYDPKKKLVTVYEKLIDTKDAIEPVEELTAGLDDGDEEDGMMQGARIEGVETFLFGFLPENEMNKIRRGLKQSDTAGHLNKDLLETSWSSDSSRTWPGMAQLVFAIAGQRQDNEESESAGIYSEDSTVDIRTWLFKIGQAF